MPARALGLSTQAASALTEDSTTRISTHPPALGGTTAQLRTILLGSDEYFAGRGGGTNDGFLAAVYNDVFGRGIDSSGEAAYSGLLAGGVSRSDIAMTLIRSDEGSRYRVEHDYQWLLNRSADPSGPATYSNLLSQGGREETLIRILLASDEFYKRA